MKNPHAVALGRLGGAAGTGEAKARTSEQARAAVRVRWLKRGEGGAVTMAMLDERTDKSGGPDTCWPWIAGRVQSKYGAIFVDGRQRVATRVLWELMHGVKLTKRQFVCHRCDNPPCMNPKHLFLGNALINNRDKAIKGRHPNTHKTHCPKGHEYTAENTHVGIKANGFKYRICKTCSRAKYIKKKPPRVLPVLPSPSEGKTWNAVKTHCKHGHEFTPENTDIIRQHGKTPSRRCRKCCAIRSLARYHKLKGH